eukprot:TRINITY_DN34439_c0_g1_i4.p1 TRINITY_DN34439_c0_g1~~TRINITY_DN34439_c0_g1_i4.p1  ORF type:complete len:399 (-),score=51.77 TRINITY_DN34439_c0_g1_i4:65-1261(-)
MPSWEDRMVVDKDLMGVHSDVLFADPLGVRPDVSKAAAPPRVREVTTPQRAANPPQTSQPTGGYAQAHAHARSPPGSHSRARPDPEDDNWLNTVTSAVVTTVGYVMSGGSQCCSMRDRANADAARRAAEAGRPPTRKEPLLSTGDVSVRSGDTNTPVEIGGAPPERLTGKPSALAPLNGTVAAASQEARQRPRSPDAPEDRQRADAGAPGAGRGLSLPDLGGSRSTPAARGGNDPFGGASASSASPWSPEKESPPATIKPRWKWPAWALQVKPPIIEVFVEDDDTGSGRWCDAEPQSRVVDSDKRDAYLCAEYQWDDEYYVQDFGPQHVRKRGQYMTVFDMFNQASDGVSNADFTKESSTPRKAADRDRDDDDFFRYRKLCRIRERTTGTTLTLFQLA